MIYKEQMLLLMEKTKMGFTRESRVRRKRGPRLCVVQIKDRLISKMFNFKTGRTYQLFKRGAQTPILVW